MTQERTIQVTSGWKMIPRAIAGLLGILALSLLVSLVVGVSVAYGGVSALAGWLVIFPTAVCIVVLVVVESLLFAGFFTVQPNESKVLTLFGAYRARSGQAGFAGQIPSCGNVGCRCGCTTSTARSSRSTTSGATRSRLPPSSSGASATRPRLASTWRTTRSSFASRASRPCGTWRIVTPTIMARRTR